MADEPKKVELKVDLKQTDAKPSDSKQADARQTEAKQADTKHVDAKQADAKQSEAKTAEQRSEPQRSDSTLLAMSEISIWIDNYDDIFSDFDPRPYNQRALSVDFLDEARRASREKKDGQMVLRFLVPAAIRSGQHENVIRKRLKEHFNKHAELKLQERHAITRKGVLFSLAGVVFLTIATLVSYYMAGGLLKDFLIVLLEPAGWFTIWTGLEGIFFKPAEVQPELLFFTRMRDAEVKFDSY